MREGAPLSGEERELLVAAAGSAAAHLMQHLEGISLPFPTGWHLLVMQYIRPEKVGSLYVAAQTMSEDEYQGRVGLVPRPG